MEKLTKYLTAFGLDEIQVGEITSIFSKKIIINKGDYFLKEGKISDQIGFINEGMCRYFYNTENEEITRWVSLQNEFITSLGSFISKTVSNENIQAIKTTEILVASKADWQNIYDKFEFVKRFWVVTIEKNYIGLENRVFNLIALTAEERYDWMLKNQPQFNINVPDKYVSSMLGIKPRH